MLSKNLSLFIPNRNSFAIFVAVTKKIFFIKIEKEKLTLAIAKIGAYQPKCPICGNHHLGYSDEEVQNVMFDRQGTSLVLVSSVSFQPTIAFTCDKCGYVMQFDLITILGKENVL